MRPLPRLGELLGSAAISLDRSPAAGCPWEVADDELGDVTVYWPKQLEWAHSWAWVSHLYYGLKRRLPVKHQEIPQHFRGPVSIRVRIGARVHPVALSYSDYIDIENDRVDEHDIVFKMQFKTGGYGDRRIVPGGYTTESLWIHALLPGLRRMRHSRAPQHEVYGRFGLGFAKEIRSQALEALSSQKRFRFTGSDRIVGYREFLREVARAGICIDLPGNGPLCFRLVNYLAIGACVVAYPHGCDFPVPLEDRRHIAYASPDLSDLVDLCDYYMMNQDAREAMRQSSADYYDRHLSASSLTSYYLRTIIDRLR
jgi:hypothetical protein